MHFSHVADLRDEMRTEMKMGMVFQFSLKKRCLSGNLFNIFPLKKVMIFCYFYLVVFIKN